MKKVNLLIVLMLFWIISGQSNQEIKEIETAYKNGSLTMSSYLLEFKDKDNAELRSVKYYFKGILDSDLGKAIDTHTINFISYPTHYYGQLSGIQLIILDYINKDYNKALVNVERVNSYEVPDALYWKAKIFQALQRYDEAIAISQNFILSQDENQLIQKVWVIILECYYCKRDILNFDKYYEQFSKHKNFSEYKAYILYLQGLLNEKHNVSKSLIVYDMVITEFPESQYRVQAEDRLLAIRNGMEYAPDFPLPSVDNTPVITIPTPPQNIIIPEPTPITTTPTPVPTPTINVIPNTTISNVEFSRYEDLPKKSYYLQFIATSVENSARNLVNTLKKENINVFYITKPVNNNRLFAVVQGPYESIQQAQEAQKKIPKQYETFIFKTD
jgi:tetratricopeptide (TPR) repeat protein